MSFFRKLFGSEPALEPVTAEVAFASFTKRRRQLQVVGESFYQRELNSVLRRGNMSPSVDLFPEPKNPHDTNAVAVLLEGMIIGHLARPNAATFRREMATLGYSSRTITGIGAGVYGGGDENWGVFLMMPSDVVVRMLDDESSAP